MRAAIRIERLLRTSGWARGRAEGAGEWLQTIEPRLLLSGAFDTVGLTALRADPAYAGIDGSGVGVAILDTGIYSQHPDLAPNFVGWYDAVRRTSDMSQAFDPEGHGSHVAGTAAGRNPAIGVATQARLISVRVFPGPDESQPRYDTIADGLQWVISHQMQYNIRVVNMSLGTMQNFNSVPDDESGEAALIHRLEGLGVTVVASSGNGYADFTSPGAAAPAVFSTLSVASTWEDDGVGDEFPIALSGGGPYAAIEREGRRDRLAATSQRSSLPNQVAAPGQTIYSSWNNENGNLYNTISGTSMAAPLVTGMVALMQDAAKTYGGRYLSTGEVVGIVRETADTIIDSNVTTNARFRIDTRQQSDLPETGLSFKRVNIFNAIRRVRMLLTGTTDPGPVTGDVDDRISRAIVLGKTDGNTNLGAEGAIGSDGSINAGAADVDLYKFELASRGNVTLALSNTRGGTAFDSYLRLFDAAGTQIAADDNGSGGGPYSRISTGILEPGVYYVGVSATPNSGYNAATGAGKVDGGAGGDYQIVVALSNPDPNGVATGAVAIDKLPKLIPGDIGSDLGVPVGAGDVDFFLITAPDTGTLVLDVDTSALDDPSLGVDAVLRVFDTDFNQVAINDDRAMGDRDPLLMLHMTRGQTYYVAVADYANIDFDPRDPFSRNAGGTGGEYDLNISFDNGDANGTVFNAASIPATSTNDGVIGFDGGMSVGADGGKDVDFFKFTAASDGIIDLRASSPDGSLTSSLKLWVYDSAADNVVQVGEAFGDVAVLRSYVQSGQSYYISVTGQGNNDFDWFAPAGGAGGDTGNYRLQSTLRPLSFARTLTDDSIQNNRPSVVTVGSQVSADIGDDGGFVIGADDVDVYKFVATATQRVVVRTLCNQEESTDTVLRIFDSAGRQIAFNDDVSNTDRGSRVTITVHAGQTYYFGVNGYSSTATAYSVLTGDGAADGKEGSYALSITPGAAAEVDVGGLNGVPIVSGDTTPSATDGTRFGTANVGVETLTQTFTIYNTGNRPLNLTGAPRVVVSGAQASEFVVVAQPAATVGRGSSVTFRVRFNPTAAGTRRATITIASNDLDEGTYTFAVSGDGVYRPEIAVGGGNNGALAILSGDDSPRGRDGTDFGVVGIGGSRDKVFRIKNLGKKVLKLTGTPRVTISGEGAGDFVVISQPGSTVGGGLFSTLTLRFFASTTIRRTALVTILSNDGDERIYTFAVAGTGV